MPAPKRRPASHASTEDRLLRGSKAAQKLVATSASLMRQREVLHAQSLMGSGSIMPGAELKRFSSLWKITDPPAVFTRCRELAGTGFIEWVLHTKKLLFNDGLKIEGTDDAALQIAVRRIVHDLWIELLIQNSAVIIWQQPPAGTLPVAQILDCEAVRYENDFGFETLAIKYDSRQVSEAQRAKIGDRYADALTTGQPLEWGKEAGEGFSVFTHAKLGCGLGRPRLFAVFEDLAFHGLLTKGDWNAAWLAKDVIRQFAKGHDIKTGNMAGMPVHFLKASERDAIHKATKDKQGAFDIVTNFDVEVRYPAFDFKFFHEDKYAAVRQRLLEWSGPVGAIHLDDGRRDDETLLTLLRAESSAARQHIAAIVGTLAEKEGFEKIKGVKLKWNEWTLASFQHIISLTNAPVTNGVMSKITARSLLHLDDGAESANLKKEHGDLLGYTPSYEPFQGQSANTTPPTPEGGRPPEPRK